MLTSALGALTWRWVPQKLACIVIVMGVLKRSFFRDSSF